MKRTIKRMKRIGLSLTDEEFKKIIDYVEKNSPGVKPATFAKMTLLSYIKNSGKYEQLDMFKEK